jgi:hypothetical protein
LVGRSDCAVPEGADGPSRVPRMAVADPGGDMLQPLRGLRQPRGSMIFFLLSFLPSKESGVLCCNLCALSLCFCVLRPLQLLWFSLTAAMNYVWLLTSHNIPCKL